MFGLLVGRERERKEERERVLGIVCVKKKKSWIFCETVHEREILRERERFERERLREREREMREREREREILRERERDSVLFLLSLFLKNI